MLLLLNSKKYYWFKTKDWSMLLVFIGVYLSQVNRETLWSSVIIKSIPFQLISLLTWTSTSDKSFTGSNTNILRFFFLGGGLTVTLPLICIYILNLWSSDGLKKSIT